MAKNEQLNFYVNYEGKFGKHSISAMAAVEKMQAYMHSKRMLFNNPDPDGYLGTSPSAGTMDTGNSITYKYKQGSLSYLGPRCFRGLGSFGRRVYEEAAALMV